MDSRSIFGFLMMSTIVSLLSGCDDHLTPDDVRRNEPSFKVWKEEIFYNVLGEISSLQRWSKDSVYYWQETNFPSDSARYVFEYRNRTVLYGETSYNNGWVYIDYILTDDTVKRPANKSLAFYPSGQIAVEGMKAAVSGYLATNCKDVYSFSLNTDSLLKHKNGNFDYCYEVEVGLWKRYHENGKVKSVQHYDTIFGECRERIDLGDKSSLAYLVSFLPILHGTTQYFNTSGLLIKTENWQKGRLVQEESFD